ncbi:transcriptional regulator PpsR [Polymorphobacter arshaanensis]|uniref:Transcriptional regulator PpsR n=1 Tax=Glacieibacterium arshaanense TaxID=2511025 RepID=A0A4Y9EM65_9SPHN|nr:transcriptional regulator PpsR [Polymorphobacter arshaanensis]TFU03098.1 transcriptional regulator PpsR [Polymorphobacter arshaanensis]
MNKLSAPSRNTAFKVPGAMPGTLSADVAADLLAAVGDVTFILSADGTILDAAVSQGDLANHGFTDWVGDPWIDTMTPDSRPKVVEMLADATSGVPTRWRQVNHPAAGGDVPVRYLVMGLGDHDRLIAIGRDMRGAAAIQQRLLQTQQSLERDYIRLRQAETRYRLLFDMTSEPVLVVDAGTRRIREANPAAHRLLEATEGALIGTAIDTIVDPKHRDDLVAHLGAAEIADDLAPLKLALRDRHGDASISARLFRQARTPLLIVRIEPARAAAADSQLDATLDAVIERMPDAFVLVDRDLNVLAANAAFVELTTMPSIDRVIGERLGSWLGRPGIDLELIVGQLREHGAVRNVATILRGAAGAQEEVEISGVVAPMGSSECYGFTIRNVGRRLRGVPATTRDVPRSVDQLTELVGRMSLKEIVRESTDLIERLCIEAALVYTSDNRASAAEILGVSRQSLYSKMHRHGVGNLSAEDS